MKTDLLFAVAAFAAAATPALARDTKPTDTSGQVSQPAANANRPAARGPRYCIVETITGSIIAYKTCKTRGEWLQEGFDPLAK